MAVLINKATGYAEMVPDQAAAVAAGTHDLPLVDQEGATLAVPENEAAQAMQSGLRPPTQEELKEMVKFAQFDTPSAKLGAAASGLANTALLGIPSALTALTDTPDGAATQFARDVREQNPVSYAAGQIAGFIAPSGAGSLFAKAGSKAAEQVARVAGSGIAGQVGTQATRFAVENAVMQSGDELSKMFLNDPNQSIGTAAAEIGLAGLLGGAVGGSLKGVGALWDVTAGKKVTDLLNIIKNKSQGIPDELRTAADLDIAPEIQAALGDSPMAKNAAKILTESNTSSAAKYQRSLEKFNVDTKKAVLESIERTDQDLVKINNNSLYETGKEVQESLAKSINEKVAPIAKQYDNFINKFKSAEIAPETRLTMANRINQTIVDDGLLKGQNDSALKIAQDVIGKLDKQASAQDLRTFAQNLKQKYPFGSENYQIGKKVAKVLEEAQEETIERAAGQSDLFAQFKATQAEYGKFKNVLEELNDRLHLGKEAKYGASSFVRNLKDMDPESVVKRLRLKDDVGLQKLLGEQFPEILDVAKKQELDGLLKKSLDSDGEINLKKFYKNLDNTSPELRQQLISEQAQTRLGAIKQLLQKMPDRMNPSGTARTLDRLWESTPFSSTSVLGGILGGAVGGPVGSIIGAVIGAVGKEIPDATRLAMLKFLSSGLPVNSKAFKAMVTTADAIAKGNEKLSRASLRVFSNTAVQVNQPTPKQLKDIDLKVAEFQQNPAMLLEGEENQNEYYNSEQVAAMSAASARTLQYLASLRPSEEPTAPLNMSVVPNDVEKAKYNNALKIAQAPLIVLEQIQNGTLTPESMQHLQIMYPDLLQRMQNKVGEAMIDAADSKKTIPYHVKMSASMFLGQNLESSMQPNAIMANQTQQAPVQQPQAPMSKIRVSNKLNEVSRSYSTPQQSREASRK
jgi:hypothetical protein